MPGEREQKEKEKKKEEKKTIAAGDLGASPSAPFWGDPFQVLTPAFSTVLPKFVDSEAAEVFEEEAQKLRQSDPEAIQQRKLKLSAGNQKADRVLFVCVVVVFFLVLDKERASKPGGFCFVFVFFFFWV